MHLDNHRLTSPEISNLWVHYTRETMQICVTKYMLKIIEDPEVHKIFVKALEFSQNHVKRLRDLFIKEAFPIPKGFSDEDVNLEAPPLFTDKFCIQYIHTLSMHGAQAYSLAFSCSIRQEIRDFYYQCNIDTMNLYNKSIEVLLSKKLYEKPPLYTNPDDVQFINKFQYITDVLGKPRALNSIECGNIFFNLQKSMVAKGTFIAFQQVGNDKEVNQVLQKCINAANKHIGKFSNLLLNEDLHSPRSLESEITNSKIAPFSDKLMLFHSGFLVAVAVSYYGTAAVACLRADIAMGCEKAIMEDLMLLASFSKTMIKKKWMEQPPESNDRKTL
ncbi:rubrerythrin [Bacillus pakistanensis]|uniref:Rubrerythrin n=1 Tax=Rossellomorea pakistanensis TaxID=992288 RepID=A0ABS2NC26_9BACI|nr:DUF3231 family protein [Bacillus pakistanensis]MBM7585402.1 rubrerythrin [Bacillus pakistanensis]